MRIRCSYCGKWASQPNGAVNRAKKNSNRLYCNRTCAGMGRRDQNPPSEADRKKAKSLYDAKRREQLRDVIKAKKHEYFKRTYDPKKAAKARKKRMPYHVEYCRRPEYRAYKREYDRKHLAKKHYGDFADCAIIARELHQEVRSRMSDFDVRTANQTLNKTQRRKRNHA